MDVEKLNKGECEPLEKNLVSDDQVTTKPNKKREEWSNKWETFLSALGAVIGLGNIWRFPYITYKYGGGAFLIPYLMCVLIIGFPMFFLESSLGQFTRKGAMDAWVIAPIMKGVGLGSGVIAIYCSLYYIIVMAWAFNYFFNCVFQYDIPWMNCNNWYNNENCTTYDDYINNTNTKNGSELPIVQFWSKYVLRESSSIDEMGTLDNWPMVGCMILSWIIIYLAIFKGTKSTGKMVYFTAICPYVILLILVIRGCTLPGAANGIAFYIKPNIAKLLETEVWIAAGGQVCYSFAICFAVLVAYGSFSSYKSDVYKRTMCLSVACAATSFFGGFAIFSILGNMAHIMGKTVDEVVKSGPGLAFQTYPIALSMMPWPNMFNALFFFMLVLLAVDSQFCCVEGGLCLVYDRYPWTVKNKKLFVGIVCGTMLIIGLFLFIRPGGIYWFEIFNNYAVGGISLLWLVMWQSIGVGWVYGSDRYMKGVRDMIGYRPAKFVDFCFQFGTPILTCIIMVVYMVTFKPLTYNGYQFPFWANCVGWLMLMSSFLCVPGYACYEIFKGFLCSKGTLVQRITNAFKYARSSRFTNTQHGKKVLAQDDLESSVDLPPEYEFEVSLKNEECS